MQKQLQRELNRLTKKFRFYSIMLKWDKSVSGAIFQIKNKDYVDAVKEYRGNLLLVGVNYDKQTKHHTCMIEKISL